MAWRATVEVDVPVYAGVIVVASAAIARNFTIPGLTIPPDLVARLERDHNAGVDAACDLVVRLHESGAFDGVHLIPVALTRGGGAPGARPVEIEGRTDRTDRTRWSNALLLPGPPS